MSRTTDISRTGQGSGLSPEEEAFEKLAGQLNALDFDPVMLCGWRAFGNWLEILSGLPLVRHGRGKGGQGRDEFLQLAKSCGWVRFELQRETIMVRSAVAYTVEPRPVLLMQSIALDPEEVRIYDARALRRGARKA